VDIRIAPQLQICDDVHHLHVKKRNPRIICDEFLPSCRYIIMNPLRILDRILREIQFFALVCSAMNSE
jgi:hypothetical protein